MRKQRSKAKRRAVVRVALRTIFKVGSDFRGNQFTIQMVGYPEESVTPRSEMKGSTVICQLILSGQVRSICLVPFFQYEIIFPLAWGLCKVVLQRIDQDCLGFNSKPVSFPDKSMLYTTYILSLSAHTVKCQHPLNSFLQ